MKQQPADMTCRVRAIYQRLFGRPNRRAIVITGNQKTGSTAIGTLLARACKQTFSMDPFYHIKQTTDIDLLEKRTTVRQIIEKHPGFFATDIIKELCFVFFIEETLAFFEGGRFVFIIRDPRDNIRSILNRLKLPGNLEQLSEQDIQKLPTRGWREVVAGNLYGTAGDNYIQTLAKRWAKIASVYELHRERMHLIRYEDFMADKKAAIVELAGRLGLAAKYDISRYIDVQYQPKGDNSASWLEFFGQKNLRIIEQTCGKAMSEFGYALSL